ncbi:MAG TPA: HNH endonuclease signature motif containing protein, partial [Gemmataceae bacterium]|nr:HNH endonuclease signature motif containing protein [Gemmataceae bacterium]
MSDSVPDDVREFVRLRAGRKCEYCLLHEEDARLSHEPDHIIAIKHQGSTVRENLAWTCFVCNRFKGSDIGSLDSETHEFVRFFNPRTDRWYDHFRL